MKYTKDDIIYVELHFENEDVLILNWGVRNCGFGQAELHPTTLTVIDDECMGEEFVMMIYEYYKDNKNDS